MSRVTDLLEHTLELCKADLTEAKQVVSVAEKRLKETKKALATETSKLGSGYVYLIGEEGTNNIKIGVAINVEKRMQQLATGNSNNLILLFKGKYTNYKQVEKKLHSLHADSCIKNEWFDIVYVDLLIKDIEELGNV